MALPSLAFICLLTISIASSATLEEPINLRPPIRQAQTLCFRRCRFHPCSKRAVATLGAPRKGGPTICRRRQNIAKLLRIGEARVIPDGGSMIPISQWRPEGLSQNFPRKFIRIANVPGRENSGLSRVASKGNQNDFTKGLCFVVPIERYERVTSSGVRVVTTDSNRDCVAFTARTPDLLIEAQWFSGDDLDLSVIEPGGAVVSNSNIRTACGRFSIDAGVDSCRLFPQGTERISYGLSCSGFVRGDEYTAVLRHSNNCQDGPTRWELRIVLNGRLLSMKKGVSDARGGRKISMLKFSV